MTTHLMLDIDTLGVRPGNVVLSAAFVRIRRGVSPAWPRHALAV